MSIHLLLAACVPLITAHPLSGCGGKWRLIVSVEPTSQRWLGYGTYHAPDPRRLTVVDRAWAGDRWIDTEHDYTASFDITRVAASGRDRLYLVGVASGGEAVIESWKGESDFGATSSRALVPVPPVFRRTQLYRGTEIAGIRGIGADPEGRFLLIAHGNPGRLSRLTLAVSYPIADLYTEAQIPELDRACAVFPLQHATLGRVWMIERFSCGSIYRSLLLDGDGDGTFDAVEPRLAHDGYEASYDGRDFIDDFVMRRRR